MNLKYFCNTNKLITLVTRAITELDKAMIENYKMMDVCSGAGHAGRYKKYANRSSILNDIMRMLVEIEGKIERVKCRTNENNRRKF